MCDSFRRYMISCVNIFQKPVYLVSVYKVEKIGIK